MALDYIMHADKEMISPSQVPATQRAAIETAGLFLECPLILRFIA